MVALSFNSVKSMYYIHRQSPHFFWSEKGEEKPFGATPCARNSQTIVRRFWVRSRIIWTFEQNSLLLKKQALILFLAKLRAIDK